MPKADAMTFSIISQDWHCYHLLQTIVRLGWWSPFGTRTKMPLACSGTVLEYPILSSSLRAAQELSRYAPVSQEWILRHRRVE